MTLLELQRRMEDDVRRPLTPDFRRKVVTKGKTSPSDVDSAYIKSNSTLSSLERLEIYNRQYWLRVINAVSEDYPALNAVLGAKRFDALVIAYLCENPSRSFTLRNLGRGLPAWLNQHPQFGGKCHALAVDVACLEWAYIEAFDNAALAPMSASETERVLPSAVLALQPHLQLVKLRYPVDELVLAAHRNTPEADFVGSAANPRKRKPTALLPNMRRGATYLAVHRYDNSVYCRRLTPLAYRLLSAIRTGHPVEVAVELAMRSSNSHPEQVAARVRDSFALASELGWIVAPESDRDA